MSDISCSIGREPGCIPTIFKSRIAHVHILDKEKNLLLEWQENRRLLKVLLGKKAPEDDARTCSIAQTVHQRCNNTIKFHYTGMIM